MGHHANMADVACTHYHTPAYLKNAHHRSRSKSTIEFSVLKVRDFGNNFSCSRLFSGYSTAKRYSIALRMRKISLVGFSNDPFMISESKNIAYSAMSIGRLLNNYSCDPVFLVNQKQWFFVIRFSPISERMTDSIELIHFISANQTRNC